LDGADHVPEAHDAALLGALGDGVKDPSDI
jgi:hypothetical protein